MRPNSHTVIEPAPAGGLTVITGESDMGKTAIFRALKWLFYNQPQGDSFRRTGCEFVEVEAEFEGGQIVSRRRTSSTNRYVVNGRVFEGFGNSVPLEVQAVTGVRPVRINGQDILANIASQLEAPFLGSSMSGPARAKVLGKLAGTEVIDQAARELNTDLFRLRQDAKRFEEDVKDLQIQVARFDYLPQLAEKLERLRQLLARVQEDEARVRELKDLASRLRLIKAREQQTQEILKGIGDIDWAATYVDYAAQLDTRLKALAPLKTKLAVILERQAKGTEFTAMLGNIEGAVIRYEHALSLANRYKALKPLEGQLLRIAQRQSEGVEQVGQLGDIEEAARYFEAAETACQTTTKYRTAYGRLQIVAANQTRANAALDKLAGVDLANVLLTTIQQAVTTQNALRRFRDSLENLRIEHETVTGTQELASQALAMAQERYKEELRNAGRCPVCGSNINDDCLTEVLAS